jgi:DNA-binding Lrp family transcriptional regulator
VAEGLGIDEATLLARLQRLLDTGVLTRFGPMFQIERLGGRFVLAAQAVPEDRFEAVTSPGQCLPRGGPQLPPHPPPQHVVRARHRNPRGHR